MWRCPQGHALKCRVVVATVTSEGELAVQPMQISQEILATPPETNGLVRKQDERALGSCPSAPEKSHLRDYGMLPSDTLASLTL